MPLPLREPIVAFGSITMHAAVVGTYFIFGIVAAAFNMYANDRAKDCASGCNESEVDRMGCWLLMRFNERRRGFIRFFSACLCGPILIASGGVMIRYTEGISWADSFYLSVASVTATGYGDKHFNTLLGKCFASIWLLVSTILSSKSAQFVFDVIMRIKRVRACGGCGAICHTCAVADLASQIHAVRIG